MRLACRLAGLGCRMPPTAEGAWIDDHFCVFREDGTGGIPKELQLFDIFSREISSIISGRKEMPPEDIVSLQVDLQLLKDL